jgi:cyclic pyranopterin phosphate synthase
MTPLDIAERISAPIPMVDPFGRTISYLRVSLTDRCDLRCSYCMPRRMTFLPRAEVLTIEELERLVRAFIRKGVKKVRLTGGEPLVRQGALTLIERLGAEVHSGALSELTLTTNGTQLKRFAGAIAVAGIKRINVSLDTLDPDKFERLTGRPLLGTVLDGIYAATASGIAVKINTVAVKGENESEIPSLISWAHARGFDLSLIEIMPMGEAGARRLDQYLPLSEVRTRLETRWTLTPLAFRTGGPSRYVRVEETGGRLGFITPLTNNFCEGCNRVRLTCTGRLYMCLGQEDSVDFRSLLRARGADDDIEAAIDAAISRKPKGHEFQIARGCTRSGSARQMSVTGG